MHVCVHVCVCVCVRVCVLYSTISCDRENINGQHLRPPVLAILLETIERENVDGLLHSLVPNL